MQHRIFRICILFFIVVFTCQNASAQKKAIIAYFSGNAQGLDSFKVDQFTHLIYCFGHVKDNKLHISRERDSLLIQKMVSLKKKNKDLKVLLSLGGWGGCAPCSDAFSTEEGRIIFARSVKELCDYFGTDGIDLDWEYPAISGYPGHSFKPEDKPNFTALVKELKTTLGKKRIVTFAAGGFDKFLNESIDWKEVMPYVEYVNLMTYDLTSGFSVVTGHHTPLFSNPSQKQSTDNCVQWLINNGVKRSKLIIGAAFYTRIWQNVEAINNGLYQSGKFKGAMPYSRFINEFIAEKGYQVYWDEVSRAPYAYNAKEKLFATFDDKRSIFEKSLYVKKHKLGGIMFWHLGEDKANDGLLQTINTVLKK